MLRSAFIFFWPCFVQEELTFTDNCKSSVPIFFLFSVWDAIHLARSRNFGMQILSLSSSDSLENSLMLFYLVSQIET